MIKKKKKKKSKTEGGKVHKKGELAIVNTDTLVGLSLGLGMGGGSSDGGGGGAWRSYTRKNSNQGNTTSHSSIHQHSELFFTSTIFC